MGKYVSKIFSTPEEFEAWINQNNHENKDALDSITNEKKVEWDNKACLLDIKDGKLRLLCKNGNVLAEAPLVCGCDGKTSQRNADGSLTVNGFIERNSGNPFKMWVGTQAEYESIMVKDPNTFYWITDETTLEDILREISSLQTQINAVAQRVTNIENSKPESEAVIEGLRGNITALGKDLNSLNNELNNVKETNQNQQENIEDLYNIANGATEKANDIINGNIAAKNATKVNNLEIKKTEAWTFTLDDGTTVTKNVVVL